MVFCCVFENACGIMKVYMNPSYTNGMGAGAFGTSAPVISSGEDVVFSNAPEKKSRKGVWILGIFGVVILVAAIIVITVVNLNRKTSDEHTVAEASDVASATVDDFYYFLADKGTEVSWTIELVDEVLAGEGDDISMDEDWVSYSRFISRSLGNAVGVMSEVNTWLQENDVQELGNLKNAFARDLPRYERFSEIVEEELQNGGWSIVKERFMSEVGNFGDEDDTLKKYWIELMGEYSGD